MRQLLQESRAGPAIPTTAAAATAETADPPAATTAETVYTKASYD